jgi:hypothetical protein
MGTTLRLKGIIYFYVEMNRSFSSFRFDVEGCFLFRMHEMFEFHDETVWLAEPLGISKCFTSETVESFWEQS